MGSMDMKRRTFIQTLLSLPFTRYAKAQEPQVFHIKPGVVVREMDHTFRPHTEQVLVRGLVQVNDKGLQGVYDVDQLRNIFQSKISEESKKLANRVYGVVINASVESKDDVQVQRETVFSNTKKVVEDAPFNYSANCKTCS